MRLPPPVAELGAALGAQRGVVAVALGGSRAAGTDDAGSDWDLGVYYRGAVDLTLLARHGEVHPPGAWGRLMNGGAWLTLDGLKVDVLLRDLDVVLHWAEEARRGRYEVDALLGYAAGAPTYMLLAELAVNHPVVGALPEAGPYPDALAEVGERRWRSEAPAPPAPTMRAATGTWASTIGERWTWPLSRGTGTCTRPARGAVS